MFVGLTDKTSKNMLYSLIREWYILKKGVLLSPKYYLCFVYSEFDEWWKLDQSQFFFSLIYKSLKEGPKRNIFIYKSEVAIELFEYENTRTRE